MLLRAKKRVSS